MPERKIAARGATPLALSNIIEAHARMVGEDPPAQLVLAAAGRAYPALTLRARPDAGDDDYTLIDPQLAIVRPADPAEVPPPGNGLGYAGLTAEQRGVLLDWLADTRAPIARPYQDFYVAHLEVRLLEAKPTDRAIHGWMTALQAAPPWRRHEGLARAVMLGFYLYDDGPGLVNWLLTTAPTNEIVDLALSLQAQLKTPLSPAQLGELMVRWSLTPAAPPLELLRSRLDSLTAALGDAPLAHARACWDEAARIPAAWRCLHRDLRLAIPQPAVRPWIEPALTDVLQIAADSGSARSSDGTESDADNAAHAPDSPRASVEAEGSIVLEFQHSRSEYFDYVLDVARRMEGFSQLMDEDRHIIYRVTFRKHKLRQFWRIWDYVQSWNSTRVYADGEELEKWKIWPYSQYLR